MKAFFDIFRFILPLIFYIVLQSTNILKMCFSGPQNDLLDVDNQACRTYWWTNLLLINNYLDVENMVND